MCKRQTTNTSTWYSSQYVKVSKSLTAHCKLATVSRNPTARPLTLHTGKKGTLDSRSLEVDFNRATKRKFHPCPVALSLLLGFPWLVGAGMGWGEWHTAL